MADHIDGCDGTDCGSTECALCDRCFFMFAGPGPLHDVTQKPREGGGTERVCELCLGIIQPKDDGTAAQAVAYAANTMLAKFAEISGIRRINAENDQLKAQIKRLLRQSTRMCEKCRNWIAISSSFCPWCKLREREEAARDG